MLTDRAKEFLATLDRRPSVPTEEVERLILGNGFPCFDKWLSFHEEYAGYVEDLGGDKAIWGLVHKSPQWLDPLFPEVDYDKRENCYDIVCADVHPSYNYLLTDSGEFCGFSSESFEIYIERKAVGYTFSLGGDMRSFGGEDFGVDVLSDIMSSGNLIVEASDKFSRYFCDKDYLLIQDLVGSGVRGWCRK